MNTGHKGHEREKHTVLILSLKGAAAVEQQVCVIRAYYFCGI